MSHGDIVRDYLERIPLERSIRCEKRYNEEGREREERVGNNK